MITYKPLFEKNEIKIEANSILRFNKMNKNKKHIIIYVAITLFIALILMLLSIDSFIRFSLLMAISSVCLYIFNLYRPLIYLKPIINKKRTLQITYQFTNENIVVTSTDYTFECLWSAFLCYYEIGDYICLMPRDIRYGSLIINTKYLDLIELREFNSIIQQVPRYEEVLKVKKTSENK